MNVAVGHCIQDDGCENRTDVGPGFNDHRNIPEGGERWCDSIRFHGDSSCVMAKADTYLSPGVLGGTLQCASFDSADGSDIIEHVETLQLSKEVNVTFTHMLVTMQCIDLNVSLCIVFTNFSLNSIHSRYAIQVRAIIVQRQFYQVSKLTQFRLGTMKPLLTCRPFQY